MRILPTLAVVAAACGSSGDDLTAHTSFVVTGGAGSNASPLDPLANQAFDIDVVWATADHHFGDESDSAGCKTTALFGATERTAHGAAATLVQTEILDRLPDWDVRLQLCDAGAGQSTVTLEAVIDELNLAFGCFGVPASAMKKHGDEPVMTSFTASHCSATILDVVNARVFSNPDFQIEFKTGSDELP